MAVDHRRALGLRIRELRAERVITQEELADRCGMFRTYLSRLETGRANPTLDMLVAVAAALGVSLPDLFVPGRAAIEKVRASTRPSRGRVER